MNDHDLQEAQAMLRGESKLLPTMAHLRAMQNMYDEFRYEVARTMDNLRNELRKL